MPDNQSLIFSSLDKIATYLRGSDKKVHLIFAYNGTGKTRLSMTYKETGKGYDDEGNETNRDTLYFNAFTEDLFVWDNDLENNEDRKLKINQDSKFFGGFKDLEMENKIRPLLHTYADFDFKIDYDTWSILFSREIKKGESTEIIEGIKVSRGEERLFVWCLFLAIAQLAIDKQEKYSWVKYIYIDDPISSLDDHNTIAIAHHLAQLIKNSGKENKFILTTHHTLFFNVLYNELNKSEKWFLKKTQDTYQLRKTGDSPFMYHIALIKDLKKAIDDDVLYTYHFNILRTILEKAANFHGFGNFSNCIHIEGDENEQLNARMINILSHGKYSLYEPKEMLDENKMYFKQIFNNFMNNNKFNPELLQSEVNQ